MLGQDSAEKGRGGGEVKYVQTFSTLLTKIVGRLSLEQTVEATVVWLVFRSEGRWFEPGARRRVVSPDKKLYCTLPLSTQVYKWVPAIIMLGVTLRWTSIPSRRVGE